MLLGLKSCSWHKIGNTFCFHTSTRIISWTRRGICKGGGTENEKCDNVYTNSSVRLRTSITVRNVLLQCVRAFLEWVNFHFLVNFLFNANNIKKIMWLKWCSGSHCHHTASCFESQYGWGGLSVWSLQVPLVSVWVSPGTQASSHSLKTTASLKTCRLGLG